MSFYAGIGSRQTPTEILCLMLFIGKHLGDKGYTLRSGGADGADLAFARGARLSKTPAEVWLPSHSFNREKQDTRDEYRIIGREIEEEDRAAFDSVDQFHPHTIQKEYVRQLMARNYRQVIGRNAPNSKFVVCWTPEGKGGGGTGQAIRIASHYKIPVYDLGAPDGPEKFLTHMLDMLPVSDTKGHADVSTEPFI